MQRRNFVKKSVAAAIVAATPLALTGLVRAEGGGTNSTATGTTDWWGTTSSTEETSEYISTDQEYTLNPDIYFPDSAPCIKVKWWTDTWPQNKPELHHLVLNMPVNGQVPTLVCWKEVKNCTKNGAPLSTTGIAIGCPLLPANGDPLSPFEQALLNWCDTLDLKIMDPWCAAD